MTADRVGRFTPEDLRGMGARTIAYVRAHPSPGPLLGEVEDAGDGCAKGHPLSVQGARRRCLTCANERQRERRKRG